MSVALLVLMGLPGSGKTTLATAIKNHFDGTSVATMCVEYDLYLTEDCAQGMWKKHRKEMLEEIRRVSEEMKGAHGKSLVILDDNFYYRSMRYEVFRIAKELRLGFGQVFLDTPFDVCSSRNASRAHPVPAEVMHRMSSLIEPPDTAGNAWEKNSLTLSILPTCEQIHPLIAAIWENPYFPDPPSKHPPQHNSVIHQADLALRRIVKIVIQSAPKDLRPQITNRLASRKKSILDDIRMNNIELPVVGTDDAVETFGAFLKPYFSDLCHKST